MAGKVLKVPPAPEYPPEEGHYLRGNDYSPVAVVVTLNTPYGSIPPEVEELVRVSVETGAALAGTVQTENIGIEKIVANIVANPNIRYLVLCGREVEGHRPGDAIKGLIENGIDGRRTIINCSANTPYLFNIPLEAIQRFRQQVTLVNLLNMTDAEFLKRAVSSCYQERPKSFMSYSLWDPGAFPEPPIFCKITWRITRPYEVEDWEVEGVLKETWPEERL
ncbi:MAG: tetrahydromethanopterin S-methyltransferase subunit A [candidate division NC10 bacterium]|nr:tetrahydromethanopterin S-methyltransferase subunit A [candidate division NC10 bacterium]